MNHLQIFEKHPRMDAYRVGGFYSPYALVATEKRFSEAELAAIYWGYVQTDMLWPDAGIDADETDPDYWEAACKRWREGEETVRRFARLPHACESDYQ